MKKQVLLTVVIMASLYSYGSEYTPENLHNETSMDEEDIPFDQLGPKKGFYGYAGIGFVIDLQPGIEESNLSLNIAAGYRHNEHIAIGIGSGLRVYLIDVIAVVPFYIEPRYDFINNTISPYVSMAIGYSYGIVDSFEPAGVMFSPQVGLAYTMNKQVTFTFDLGYEYQNIAGAGYDGFTFNIGIGI